MSLRTRLLVALGVVALLSLVVADVVTYQELHSFLYNRVDQSLETSHMPLENAITGRYRTPGGGSTQPLGPGVEPGGSFPPPDQAASLLFSGSPNCEGLPGGLDPGTFVELRSADGKVVGHCTEQQFGKTVTSVPSLPERITGFQVTSADPDEPTTYFDAPSTSAGGFRVRASILTAGTYKGGQLIVAAPLTSTASTLDRLFDVEILVTAGALLVAILLGWWLVMVGMRPLYAMERTADAIAAGELDQRVPGDQARTEVGSLARALNVMLGRIERAFAQRDETEAELRDSEERMRQFVADASHELRTPLSAVSAYAELFGRGASSRPEDLARVIEGIRGETLRMGQLVDDLLLLARLDEGRPLERQPVELVEVAADSVQTAVTVAPGWPVRLEASQPVEVVGDKARLRQVLDNLLSNVRAHTPVGTPTVLEVGRSGSDALITVTDAGPGFTPDQASRVFERFYRADPSRSRSHGGAGLGLSIVASIVQAHGGKVAASSSEPGAVFTVRIPVAPDADTDLPGPPARFTADS